MTRGALLALLVSVSAAGTVHADARIAISNDAFSEVVPPLDDSGFTTDLAVAFWRPWRAYQLGGALFDRWLTEVGGPRREDQIELVATLERTWGRPRVRELTITGRAGPTFTGNLGGRWMQNGWHSLTRTGPTLDEGLQHDYIADRALGVLAGERATGSVGVPAVQVYGVVDAQLALGTGVTSLELAAGVRAIGRIRCTELGAHAEIALERYALADAALGLPGGYGTGAWQRAWRVGVHVAWSRYQIAYEYRANEGGSGEPIGVFALTIKQAGHAL